MAYRIGIDVGQRSVGFAAVEYDDDGFAIRLLSCVSHIHDGGMDPDTAKSPQSRLATSGTARRTRRLLRNRRRRLIQLDRVLERVGLPVPHDEIPQTHDAWHARARLSTEYVLDPAERAALLSLAIRHLARHRGWRNPWWNYARLAEAPTPSEHLTRTLAAAVEKYGAAAAGSVTAAQLVSRLAPTGVPIRPTKKAQDSPLGQVLSDQVRQEDGLAELELILQTQRVPESDRRAICEAVFAQTKPHIPTERIGRCALQPDQLRAPMAALEFQEFRIRDAVGNLRIGRKDSRRLSADETSAAVDFLMSWRDDVRPRWRDVAEAIGVNPRELVTASLDGSSGGTAPYDRTTTRIESTFRRTHPITTWWANADPQGRAELVDAATDLSDAQEPSSARLADLLEQEDTLEALDKLAGVLESGRAAYSRGTLARLNAVMRDRNCDLHEARKIAFEVDDTWRPPRPSLDDPIEHPAVSRVNALVRRFLHTAVAKWGMPESIVIEHVREAFMGPSALAELKNEINQNTRRRETTLQQLVAQGVPNPRRGDIRRNECVERQNCVCLYCGQTIGLTTCELDHIVPRARGGSSRRDNLAAVCRDCNQAKGKLAFAVFAAQSSNPQITVEAAQARVRDWAKGRLTFKTFRRLQADVRARLALAADDETDERSMESTAYAAREMRARIESFLDTEAARLEVARGSVVVLSGIATSEARKAGGVDDRLRLREMTRKSRFDRRHHAIDAAVLTSLGLGIAKTLKERANQRVDNENTGKYPEWKEYAGSSPGEQRSFAEWKRRIGSLTDVLVAAIAADEVPVVRPLRLTPRVGSVHADTVQRLQRKLIGEEFTAEEISRLADGRLHRLLTEAAAGGDLPADPGRAALLGWAADRPVEVFPSSSAYLRVRNGAVDIGGTIRYARVYAWEGRSGYEFGMIRMYVGEFAKIGFLRPGVDLFTEPLPPESMAIRTANRTLLKRIASNEARYVGWLTIDDELEIEPSAFTGGDDKIGRFLTALPESHWLITGFFDPGKISIAPALLASEGLDDSMPEQVTSIVKANRIPLSVNQVLRSPGCTIIRRSITGAPRWRAIGLPASWKPQEAAALAFDR